jgi:hypothetical protein
MYQDVLLIPTRHFSISNKLRSQVILVYTDICDGVDLWSLYLVMVSSNGRLCQCIDYSSTDLVQCLGLVEKALKRPTIQVGEEGPVCNLGKAILVCAEHKR